MFPTARRSLSLAALVLMLSGSQLTPATALADPEQQPGQPEADLLHNIVYRARVDGVSRGTTITYAAEKDQTLTASPTMVPGRVFEANTVLPASRTATLRLSVDWPYSANLHCEILVDDQLVAQADDFVAPRFIPAKDDPDYGALICEAPVTAPAAAPPA